MIGQANEASLVVNNWIISAGMINVLSFGSFFSKRFLISYNSFDTDLTMISVEKNTLYSLQGKMLNGQAMPDFF